MPTTLTSVNNSTGRRKAWVEASCGRENRGYNVEIGVLALQLFLRDRAALDTELITLVQLNLNGQGEKKKK